MCMITNCNVWWQWPPISKHTFKQSTIQKCNILFLNNTSLPKTIQKFHVCYSKFFITAHKNATYFQKSNLMHKLLTAPNLVQLSIQISRHKMQHTLGNCGGTSADSFVCACFLCELLPNHSPGTTTHIPCCASCNAFHAVRVQLHVWGVACKTSQSHSKPILYATLASHLCSTLSHAQKYTSNSTMTNCSWAHAVPTSPGAVHTQVPLSNRPQPSTCTGAHWPSSCSILSRIHAPQNKGLTATQNYCPFAFFPS